MNSIQCFTKRCIPFTSIRCSSTSYATYNVLFTFSARFFRNAIIHRVSFTLSARFGRNRTKSCCHLQIVSVAWRGPRCGNTLIFSIKALAIWSERVCRNRTRLMWKRINECTSPSDADVNVFVWWNGIACMYIIRICRFGNKWSVHVMLFNENFIVLAN